MDTLGSEQVAERAGVTVRQVDHWSRKGYLQPAPRPRETSGHPRRFDEQEARIARLMGRLTSAGLSPGAASRVVRGQDLAPGVIVTVVEDDV